MRRLVLLSLGMLIGGGVAHAAEPAGDGSGSASKEDADAAADAMKTQPQVPTVRGGSLGIPSALSANSAQIVVSGQPASSAASTAELPAKIGFDLFSRIGGLQLFDTVKVDVIAESYKQSIPHVDLLVRPVLPRMALREIRDVGFRIGLFGARKTTVSMIKSEAAEESKAGGDPAGSVVSQFVRDQKIALTLGARFLQRSDPDRGVLDFQGASSEAILQFTHGRFTSFEDCKAVRRSSEVAKVQAAATVIAATAVVAGELTELTTLRVKANQLQAGSPSDAALAATAADANKLRALIAPPALGLAPTVTKAVDALADVNITQAASGCKTGGYAVTLFAGVSGTLLHTEKRFDDTQNIENPLFKEARFTVGGDIQTTYSGAGTTLLPRVGVYMAFSRGIWEDRFSTTEDKDIRSFQFEGALYVSGHLAGGLDAVVSFVALKSYGHGGIDFLVNVAPAIGAALGGQ